MLRIGVRDFKIKEYTPQELGITTPDLQNFVFQHRQRFFHIMFIPTFPVGQYWCMREKDESFAPKLSIPYSVEDRLRELGYSESRIPWYSFALLIAIPVGFVMYLLSQSYNGYVSNENYKIQEGEFIDRIDSLRVNSFLEFYARGVEDNNGNKLTQVKTVVKDSVELLVYQSDSKDKYEDISNFSPELLEKFSRKNRIKTVWISKKRLKELRLAQSEGNSNGLPVPEFDKGRMFYFSEIKEYFGPIIETSENVFDYQTKTGQMIITNNGYDCQFTQPSYKLEHGETITFEKAILKKGESTTVTYVLVKPIEEYTKNHYQPAIGTFDCLDLVNSKKVQISFYPQNSEFTFSTKNE
jgi:hypothetical protein